MQEIKCPKCGEIFQVDESGYAAILKQVRDKEFSKEIESRENQIEKDKENAIKLQRIELQQEFDKQLQAKELKIKELESNIETQKTEKTAAIDLTAAQKDKEISELKSKLDFFNKDKELELTKVKIEMSEKLSEKESQIQKLQNEKELTQQQYLLNEETLKKQYENQLKIKDEEIERYKDYKLKLSTKMVGESLEQHCEIEFNKLRATGFQKAYFEKYSEPAQKVLIELLNKYATDGITDFEDRKILQLEEFRKFGNPIAIVKNIFGVRGLLRWRPCPRSISAGSSRRHNRACFRPAMPTA